MTSLGLAMHAGEVLAQMIHTSVSLDTISICEYLRNLREQLHADNADLRREPHVKRFPKTITDKT